MTFGETWRSAADEKIEPPRGTYQVLILGGNAFTSQKGDDCAKIDLQILDGDLKGEKFEHFMWFGHEVGARINREALLSYGLEGPETIETIEDLDDRIAAMKGRSAEVGVSYKDGRMNIRVTGSRAPEGRAPDISGKPVADFATAAASNGVDDDPPPF
jgi:hypothetical protein